MTLQDLGSLLSMVSALLIPVLLRWHTEDIPR